METNEAIKMLNPQCINKRSSAIKSLMFGDNIELTKEWFENYVKLPRRFTMMIKDNVWDFTLNELKFDGITHYPTRVRDYSKEGFCYYDEVIYFIVNIFGSCDELKKSKTENFLLPIKLRSDIGVFCYEHNPFQESEEMQYSDMLENSSDPVNTALAYHSRVMKAKIMSDLEERLESLYSNFYMIHELKEMICDGGIK